MKIEVNLDENDIVKEIKDNYSDDIELRAIVMDNRHPGFTTIMQGFYEYMKLLDKRQQMEKEQDEYKKYLELKAKFERN